MCLKPTILDFWYVPLFFSSNTYYYVKCIKYYSKELENLEFNDDLKLKNICFVSDFKKHMLSTKNIFEIVCSSQTISPGLELNF